MKSGAAKYLSLALLLRKYRTLPTKHVNEMTTPTIFRPNRLASYDEDSILAEIKHVITQHFQGNPPPKDEFDKFSKVSSQSIRKRFGSWANGIRKAGFEYHSKGNEGVDLRREKYSEELMISDLQRIKELSGGQYFSQEFYHVNSGKYSVKTLKKHFNCSWAALLQERLSLALPVTDRLKIHQPGRKCVSEYSDESLILEMKRVWDELGRRPSYSEFRKLSSIGVHVYERRYGNWKLAIESYYTQADNDSVGLGGSHATPELLLVELQKLTSQAGAIILTFDRYQELGGSYSIGTFQKHFGSWQAAVTKIGHRDGHSGKYTDEELFSEMQRLWEKYGRQPTYGEMNRDGNISGGVFQRRFGSWMQAVHDFCADRQSLNEEETPIEVSPEIEVEPSPPPAFLEQPASTLADTIATPAKTILVDARRVAGKHLRFQVLQRDSFQGIHRCVICGRSPQKHGVVLHVDHIVPWSRGGLTVLENLQTACEDCNLGKSDSLPGLKSELKGPARIKSRLIIQPGLTNKARSAG